MSVNRAPSISVRRLVFVQVVAALLAPAVMPKFSSAGVLHELRLSLPGPGNSAVFETAFGFSASDVDDEILGEASDFRPLLPGNDFPGGMLQGSVDRFGSLGLQMTAFGTFPVSGSASGDVSISVLIASDEFVNLSSFPARVISRVTVDGGSLQIHGGRDVTASYLLNVGVLNRGQAAQHPARAGFFNDLLDFVDLAQDALLGPNTKSAEGSLIADGNRDLSFEPDLHPDAIDLHATFNPDARLVQIPRSLQTLDFGVVGPGDRLLVAYNFILSAEGNSPSNGFVGFSDIPEGIFANYSDPFSLSGESAFSIEFQPLETNAVPEPSSSALAAAGLLALGLVRIRRNRTAVSTAGK